MQDTESQKADITLLFFRICRKSGEWSDTTYQTQLESQGQRKPTYISLDMTESNY